MPTLLPPAPETSPYGQCSPLGIVRQQPSQGGWRRVALRWEPELWLCVPVCPGQLLDPSTRQMWLSVGEQATRDYFDKLGLCFCFVFSSSSVVILKQLYVEIYNTAI